MMTSKDWIYPNNPAPDEPGEIGWGNEEDKPDHLKGVEEEPAPKAVKPPYLQTKPVPETPQEVSAEATE